VTGNESIENRLTAIFNRPLTPEARSQIDARFARLGDAVTTQDRRRPSRSLRRASLLGVAAALMLAAAAVAVDLFGGLLFTAGWQTAWDASVEIGQEQTVAGELVRLERGYADIGQVVLGWTGIPPGEAGAAAVLTDSVGRHYEVTDGAGTDAIPGSVTLGTFRPVEPLPVGETEFTLSFGNDVAFTFSLPVHGGATVAVGGTSVASDFAITLEEFTATPTTLLATLSLDAREGAPDGESWTPIGHLEFDGRSINLAAIRDREDGSIVGAAVEGVAEPAGPWKLVIDELVGHNGQWPENDQIRISGPWVFTFEVPGE